MISDDIINLVTQIEGPYKWYVIGVILVILTALVTRFIFKTFKWFLLLAAAAIIILAIVNYFTDTIEENSEPPTSGREEEVKK